MNSTFKILHSELKVLLTAIMFYTRIPVPGWVDHSSEYLNKATRYFPLIGWVVGATAGLTFYVSQLVLPASISIAISMATSILLTGAFHEDGFADVCDGFGGGWTKSKILEIMKDSVIGAYGVVGLVMILLLKYLLLLENVPDLSNIQFVLMFIAAHSMSRFAATTMIFSHNYVRENENSKAKPIAKKLAISQLFIAGMFGITPILTFGKPLLLLTLIPVLFMKSYLGSYFKKWIGGYTGDCLGATQQACEIIFYISFLILWKFT